MDELDPAAGKSARKALCRIGGVAALILLVYSIVTVALLIVLGGPPASAEETFALLQDNRLLGLLRLDVLTVIAIPLYYLLFASLYAALRRTNEGLAALATVLAFAGITLLLTTPSASSMVSLSDKYAAATTAAEKARFLAAGEAIVASDMWHGTGAMMGGFLSLGAGVLISIVMWQSKVFSKVTAGVGLLTQGLDLAHVVVSLFLPGAGFILMAIAGPLYLIWFPLVSRGLLQLARAEGKAPE
jgi:hypothetical protein